MKDIFSHFFIALGSSVSTSSAVCILIFKDTGIQYGYYWVLIPIGVMLIALGIAISISRNYSER